MKDMNILKWLIGLVCLMFVGCNSWLDLKPDDKVAEEDLFKDREGFASAENGLYLDMAAEDLYGKELACGFIEALAQQYNIQQQTTGNAPRYLFISQYKYTDQKVKSMLDATWKAVYKVIANCNNLLEQAPKYRNVFPSESDFNDYMGRLYALRAFLHFDVFRLWGPIYSDASKERKCIPYYKIRTSLPVVLSTAGEVVGSVLQDLHAADSLMTGEQGTYKMFVDRFAVRALRARVYLYAGEKQKAYEEALGLIGPDGDARTVYPFVTSTAAQNASAPDRLFYSEQIFLLENSRRNALYEDMFDYMLDDNVFLAPTVERITKLFPNTIDYRYLQWKVNPGNGKGVSFVKFSKISDDNNPARTRGQSLLKVSELYLILAECSTGIAEQTMWLDKLRVGRGYQEGGITDAEKADWAETLRQEYQREFYGEGQYFFYLKRNRVSSIEGFGSSVIDMGEAQYELPLPDSESQNR